MEMKQALSLQDRVQQEYGMNPNVKRNMLFPLPTDMRTEADPRKWDWSDWTAPTLAYDAVQAGELARHVSKGGQYAPKDVLNMVMTLMGMGTTGAAMGGVPRGALAANAIPSGRTVGERAPFSKTILNYPLDEMNAGRRVLERPGLADQNMTLTPEDLHGNTLTNFVGDRTDLGTLTHIRDKKLPTPIELHGGKKYMRDGDDIWASKETHVKPFMKAAEENEFGDLIGSFSPLGGSSGDFSHMMLETLARDLDLNAIPKGMADDINHRMRTGVGIDKARPDFVGVDSNEVMGRLNSVAEDRKAMIQILAKREFADGLGLDPAEARHAITDPDLLMLPPETAAVDPMHGFSFASIDPAQGLKKTSQMDIPHPTYDTALSGQHLGGLEQKVPRSILFPDWFQGRRESGAALGKDTRSFNISNVKQKATDEWLENLNEWVRKNPGGA